MVVQRGRPVHVWGSANPGEKVTASFRGETAGTTTDELGRWSVWLKPGEAGGPFDLNVNSLTLRDVLVGDVWVAAGQSNMEWPVDWSAEPERERQAANWPRLRLARTMHRVSDYPRTDWVGKTWAPCTPDTVREFSAVGYHFGRNVHEKSGIPVGVVQAAWGGTPIEAWTSLRGLSSDPGLMPVFSEWAETTEKHEAELLRFPQRMAQWKAAGSKGFAPELRRRPGGQWMPAGLFNAMIAPLTQMPIRGVIWYQGEANTSSERAPLYERLFPNLIRDWREWWGQGDFSFLFVQLANYVAEPESQWPVVREAQRRSLSVANTAMAVTVDIGDPRTIHPGNKREVGRRLALALDGISGPLFRQATREGHAVRIWFDRGDLVAGGELKGFEAAGEDNRFVPAEARIDGRTVVVSGVERARRVRYAWADNPPATLFSGDGLPASPFVSAELR
jgi:sialate O-acetylesterase